METEKWKLTLGKRNIDHRGGAGGRGGGQGRGAGLKGGSGNVASVRSVSVNVQASLWCVTRSTMAGLCAACNPSL